MHQWYIVEIMHGDRRIAYSSARLVRVGDAECSPAGGTFALGVGGVEGSRCKHSRRVDSHRHISFARGEGFSAIENIIIKPKSDEPIFISINRFSFSWDPKFPGDISLRMPLDRSLVRNVEGEQGRAFSMFREVISEDL